MALALAILAQTRSKSIEKMANEEGMDDRYKL